MARRPRSLAADQRAIASMAAAPPTTRASTASTWRRSRPCREARGGKLGFNAKFLIEMGEEVGSPGLREVCEGLREDLAADVFIASDGPRLSAEQPTLFLGSAAACASTSSCRRCATAGIIPATGAGCSPIPATILSSAIASMVDAQGPDAARGAAAAARFRTRCAMRWRMSRSSQRPDEPAIVAGLGRAGPVAGRAACSAGTRWRCWRCRRAIPQARPMRSRGGRTRCCSCASSSAPDRRRSIRCRADASATRMAFRWSRCASAQRLCRLARRPRQPVGRLGRGLDRADHRQGAGASCRISAARCRTMCSPKGSACRRSGCRTPIPAARSTRRTNTSCCR